MATLSQFRKKSKYVVEGRGGSKKNVGEEGTRNIDKKFDILKKKKVKGGAEDTQKFIDEFDLDNKNKTKTSNTNKTTISKKLSNSKTVNFSSGASGTTPSGSVDLANTDKKFVQNRRTPLNVKKPDTSSLNVSNTKNIVDKDKFSDVRKFQDLNKRAKEILNKSDNTVSSVSNQNKINKIPKNEVKPVKINNVIKNVDKPSNTIKLPNVTSNTSSLNLKNNIKQSVNLPNFVRGRTKQGNIITQNLSNYNDPEVEKIIKDAENLKNPKSRKAYKQAKKDFKSFIKNPQVIKKVSPFVKAASGVAAALDGRGDYKASRDMGYNKAQSVARAVTMGLGKYIGGTKGAVLGGKFGLVGAIPGGMAGYHYGGKGAEYAFDSLVSTKGRKKLKKNFTNFMDNVRGKK